MDLKNAFLKMRSRGFSRSSNQSWAERVELPLDRRCSVALPGMTVVEIEGAGILEHSRQIQAIRISLLNAFAHTVVAEVDDLTRCFRFRVW